MFTVSRRDLYYLADRDSGRLTQKILEHLEEQDL